MDINKNVYDLVEKRMKKLFASTLGTMEEEVKKFMIDEKFFESECGGKNKVKKTLFDQGNEILRLVELVMAEIEIVPKKGVVYLNDKNQD